MAKQNSNVRVYRAVGSSVEGQLAHREGEDIYFIRYRERDPRYGYKWTPWRETKQKPYLKSNGHDSASYSETESGWIEMTYNVPTVRLPRARN